MSVLQRPTKQGNATSYQGKVALGYTAILAAEMDADLDLIYAAWNDGTDTVNIADGAVTTDKLAPGAVTTDKLAPGAVTPDKLAPAAYLWTAPAAATLSPVTAAARVVLPGPTTAEATDQAALVFGTRTMKGRLLASPATDGLLSLTANATLRPSGYAADDGAKPGWLYMLDTGNDQAVLMRLPPGGGASQAPFFVKGDGKTYCTLADGSVSAAMLGATAKAGAYSGTVDANKSTTTSPVQFASVTASGLFGRVVMVQLTAMMGVTSTSGASNITIYCKRNGTVMVSWNLYVTGGPFEVPVPMNLTYFDPAAPIGSVTYTWEMQASVAGTNVHTAAANQGVCFVMSWN